MYVPGVRNISFSQNFANEINEWSQGHIVFISKGCHIFFLVSTLIILSWRQSMMNRHNYHQIYGIRHADFLQCTISPRRQSTKYLCICWHIVFLNSFKFFNRTFFCIVFESYQNINEFRKQQIRDMRQQKILFLYIRSFFS